MNFESGGVELSGELSDPGSKTVVVLCHGFGSTKDSGTNLELVKRLHAAGIATFRFDFFGHGESGGSFEDVTISIGVQNALDAVGLMEKQYEKIALVGSSYGGYVGYMVGSKKQLVALALKCPVADWSTLEVEMEGPLAEDALKSIAYDSLANIQAPTLIVHGDKDTLVPLDQSRKAAELIPHCMLAVVDGADHRFEESDTYDKMLMLLSNFIIEQVNV